MSWTKERETELQRLWKAGWTASQIANNLGGVSRNAVIGKIHRLGAADRKIGHKRKPSPPKPRAPKPRKPVEKPMVPEIVVELVKPVVVTQTVVIPLSGRVTLADLREGLCKWPHGDPRHEDFHFCGGATPGVGIPYCGAHMKLAYRPEADRRRWDKTLGIRKGYRG